MLKTYLFKITFNYFFDWNQVCTALAVESVRTFQPQTEFFKIILLHSTLETKSVFRYC